MHFLRCVIPTSTACCLQCFPTVSEETLKLVDSHSRSIIYLQVPAQVFISRTKIKERTPGGAVLPGVCFSVTPY